MTAFFGGLSITGHMYAGVGNAQFTSPCLTSPAMQQLIIFLFINVSKLACIILDVEKLWLKHFQCAFTHSKTVIPTFAGFMHLHLREGAAFFKLCPTSNMNSASTTDTSWLVNKIGFHFSLKPMYDEHRLRGTPGPFFNATGQASLRRILRTGPGYAP